MVAPAPHTLPAQGRRRHLALPGPGNDSIAASRRWQAGVVDRAEALRGRGWALSWTPPGTDLDLSRSVTSLYYGAMSDDRPKSAYEIAMERLRKQDTEAGVEERPLTVEQKAAIAEARQVHEAKIAEREILHQAALRNAGSHEEVERLNEELRRDKERLASARDRKIAEIRKQDSP